MEGLDHVLGKALLSPAFKIKVNVMTLTKGNVLESEKRVQRRIRILKLANINVMS